MTYKCWKRRKFGYHPLISLFIVQRNFGNVIYDYVQKYDTLKIEQLRKYKKLKIKIRKAELDAMFLRICQIFNATSKFLTINLPNVSSYDLQFIKKRLLRSAVNKRNKELRSLLFFYNILMNRWTFTNETEILNLVEFITII